MALANLIRQASLGAIEAGQPVAVMFATVTKTDPLEVNVEQRFTLTTDFLILTDTIDRKVLDVGDRVILLRVQGGRQFVVLDKVV